MRLLLFQNSYGRLAARARRILAGLPPRTGSPIRVRFVEDLSRHGPIHAGSLVRQRRILLETGLARHPGEFSRIFVHELFHFVWLRLGNPRRREFENLLRRELAARVSGELGWSAEWRKHALTARDRRERTRRWREYVCESFCDSAAWYFSSAGDHDEVTLPPRTRARRSAWFRQSGVTDRISL